MAGKILDDSGLTYFWGKLKTLFNDKVDKVTGKGLSTNDFTTAYKNKVDRLDGSLIVTGDIETFVDDLDTGVYYGIGPDLVITECSETSGYYLFIDKRNSSWCCIIAIHKIIRKNKIYIKNKISGVWVSWMEVGTANDYTTTEKSKLAGIEANANKTTIASSITQSGTNPVQSSAIYTALAGKVDTVSGKGLSTNDYTTTEKNKLAGIDTGANKTTVDSSLSSSSTNPLQNKAIYTALSNKVDTVSGKGLSTNDFTTAYKNKIDRLDAPILSQNVTAYADSLSAGVYFARHATTPAYDQPTTSTRIYYTIHVYASTTASIMAVQGQTRSNAVIYIKTKTEGTWGSWYKFTGTAV